MAIRIKAVLWDPVIVDMPLTVEDWEMYSLPESGTRYWHGRWGYEVERIEENGETRVHFRRDPEWEEALYGELPDDYYIDAGRDSEHGRWHALVVGPNERFAGDAFGDDPEQVIREAVARALETIGGADA